MNQTNKDIKDYSLRSKAISKARKGNMYIPAKVTLPSEFTNQEGNLHVPYDLTDISTEELGRYLTLFTQLTGYYEAVVACADIDLMAAERVKDFTEAKVLLEIGKEKGGTLTEKKAHRTVDPRVIEARDWYDEMKAFYELSNALLKSCDKLVFMLSREVTRRGGFQAQESRLVNVYKNIDNKEKLIDQEEQNGED